jgi:hypothetical protein
MSIITREISFSIVFSAMGKRRTTLKSFYTTISMKQQKSYQLNPSGAVLKDGTKAAVVQSRAKLVTCVGDNVRKDKVPQKGKNLSLSDAAQKVVG